MQWAKVTDIILITSFLVLGVFALLGLYQLITRKSLKKVDRNLLAFIPPLALMAITYVIFDKFWIVNTRPDGSGEPSFPSSHTMIVATIFFIAILNLNKYIKQKPLRIILEIVMLALIAITATGRVLSNKHWPADVICGLVFAFIFAGIYSLIAKKSKKSQKSTKTIKEPTNE